MKQEFILASNNQKKLVEMQEILSQMGYTVLSQREAGCNFEVEETGTTFAENAYLKASAVTALPESLQSRMILVWLLMH